MMKIPKMGEEDLLFQFIDGIKAWAELELEDRGVKEISTEIKILKHRL